MRTPYDFSPLYRSTVGFDRLFDLLDSAARVEASWPPYNIEKVGADEYRITMAVAGFGPDDIEMVQEGTSLTVSGQRQPEPNAAQYLHRGIAGRSFKQTFSVAEHVKVTGASLENGMLTVDLVREVPEAYKPRRISIGQGTGGMAQDNGQPVQIERQAKVA
jgi:molecular chaperone IbpA